MKGSRSLLPAILLVAACGSAGVTGVGSPPDPTAAPTTLTTTTTTTAAASTTTTPPATTTTTTTTHEPAADSESLAEFEGIWLCELSRRSYADLAEMESHRNELLEAAGFTEADYLEFREGLDQDPGTRAEVMDSYLGRCAGD